ncbi:hypothetical protein P9112_012458 [Eukaryota sp. TZLM1-RC]
MKVRYLDLDLLTSASAERNTIRGWFFSSEHAESILKLPEVSSPQALIEEEPLLELESPEYQPPSTLTTSPVRAPRRSIGKPYIPPPPLSTATKQEGNFVPLAVKTPLPAPNCVCQGALKNYKSPSRVCDSCKNVYHEVCVRFNWRSLSSTSFKFHCPKCRPNSYYYEYQELYLPSSNSDSSDMQVHVLSAVPYGRFVQRRELGKVEQDHVKVCGAPECFKVIKEGKSGWKATVSVFVPSSDQYLDMSKPDETSRAQKGITKHEVVNVLLCDSCHESWNRGELCTICHSINCKSLATNQDSNTRIQCSLCLLFSHLGCMVSQEHLDLSGVESFYACVECREGFKGEIDLTNVGSFSSNFFNQDDDDYDLIAKPFDDVDEDFVQSYRAVSVSKIVSDLQTSSDPNQSTLIDRLSVYYVIGQRFASFSSEERTLLLSNILANFFLNPIYIDTSEFSAFISILSKYSLIIDPIVLFGDLAKLYRLFKGYWRRQLLSNVSNRSFLVTFAELFADLAESLQLDSTQTSFSKLFNSFKSLQKFLISQAYMAEDHSHIVRESAVLDNLKSKRLESECREKLSSVEESLLKIKQERGEIEEEVVKINLKIKELQDELDCLKHKEDLLATKESQISDRKDRESVIYDEQLIEIMQNAHSDDRKAEFLDLRKFFFFVFAEFCSRITMTLKHAELFFNSKGSLEKRSKLVSSQLNLSENKSQPFIEDCKHFLDSIYSKISIFEPLLTRFDFSLDDSLQGLAVEFRKGLVNSLVADQKKLRSMCEELQSRISEVKAIPAGSDLPPTILFRRSQLIEELNTLGNKGQEIFVKLNEILHSNS